MATIRFVDTQVIERVLGMGSGYVLPGPLSDSKFSAFFAEHGVDIDNAQYKSCCDSKGPDQRQLVLQLAKSN